MANARIARLRAIEKKAPQPAKKTVVLFVDHLGGNDYRIGGRHGTPISAKELADMENQPAVQLVIVEYAE